MNDKDVELFFRCAVLYARAWQDILEEEETSSIANCSNASECSSEEEQRKIKQEVKKA